MLRWKNESGTYVRQATRVAKKDENASVNAMGAFLVWADDNCQKTPLRKILHKKILFYF
jgi:hypothetical protein